MDSLGKMAPPHGLEPPDRPLIGREETVGEIVMDITVSVGLMSEHSQARRTLLRCRTALVYLGTMVERWKARAEAAEGKLAAIEAAVAEVGPEAPPAESADSLGKMDGPQY